MRSLRWLALLPLAAGLLALFVALVWTEWVPFLFGVGLAALAAVVWRAFAKTWPFANRTAT